MSPEDYWNVKMSQYITRFTTFRKMIIQATGITDEEAIQEHWNLFADNFCGCESCSLEDDDDAIEIRVPADYLNMIKDDEGWDDETPTWEN